MKKDVSNKKSSKRTFLSFCKTKKQKVIFISLSIVLLLSVFAGVFYLLLSNGDSKEDDSLFYYPASESTNIFQNEAYMSFVRDLRYSYGGIEQLFQFEKDYESGDAYCKFFLDYFNALIHGDGEKLTEFYVDGYFDSVPEFTMQMIYEPYVFFHSEGTIEENGEEIKVANFEVRYKIFKNNGSFRKGVASNQAVPQIYQLINDNGKLKIKNILEISYEDED